MEFSEDLMIDANRFLAEFYSGKDVIALHAYGDDIKSTSYYEQALSYFDEKCDVLVFTDNLDWYENCFLFQSSRFIASEGHNYDFDMCLTSFCDAHIMGTNGESLKVALNSKSQLITVPKHVKIHQGCDHNKNVIKL